MPFGFAVWAARRSSDLARVRRIHQALLASRAWGLSHLDQLADAAALTCNARRATCLQYLAGLDYALSYKHLAGLTDFFRRLARRGVVPGRGAGRRRPSGPRGARISRRGVGRPETWHQHMTR